MKANPDQGGTYTYNGEKNSFTVSLMYSTEQTYYNLASTGAKMTDYQSFGAADLKNYIFVNNSLAQQLLNGAPQYLTLAGRIQYKSTDQAERAFLFPSDSSLLDITPVTETISRTYTVQTPVSDAGDSEDSEDSGDDESSGDTDSGAAAAAERSDNNGSNDSDNSGSDTDKGGGGGGTRYTYETKTQTADFVVGYYLRIRQKSFASWFTNESTPDGIIPAMGDGYLRYWYQADNEEGSTGKVTLTRTSGTLQTNDVTRGKTYVDVKGTLRNAVFLQPADNANEGSSYLFLCTSEEVRVLQYKSAMVYIKNKEKEPDAVFSGSNRRFNFRRNDVEGKDSSKEESIDVSDTLDEELTSTGAESTDSGSTIGVDLKSELQDSMSANSIAVLPGSYNASEHLWVLSAGVTGGLVLTDLLRAAGEDRAEDIASVQLSSMPCYAVYASDGGKAVSVIGYDNSKYSYSSGDLYRAKLYHRSLFDKEMCYNMVMSLAKKDTSLYQSMLTDSSAFLTRLSNYWQLTNYKADLTKAKEYIRYRKLVQNGKSEAVSLFCKLSGLKEGALSEDAMTQLESCYDQSAVENLILTLRPELADSTNTSDSQDSGIKISKDSTVRESSASGTETEAGDSSQSDSGVSIKADTDKSYQEAQRRQKLRTLRCSELQIQESEWNADMSTLVEDLHPADSLEAYIRQRCLRYFASMGNLSYTDDMRLQLLKCSTWEEAEALIGTLRLSADEQLSLSTLKSKSAELSDEQKTKLAALEAKQKDAVNAAKLEAIKNLHDLDDSRKLLSEEYGSSWNDQWQKYWKETLTRIVDAAKTQS